MQYLTDPSLLLCLFEDSDRAKRRKPDAKNSFSIYLHQLRNRPSRNCTRETGNSDVLLCLHEGLDDDNKKLMTHAKLETWVETCSLSHNKE